jgi:segregation and condensation protein B
MSLKSRVEAVLFLTDKPVVAAVVAKLVNEDVQLVRQAIMQLIYDYEQRNCALEISDDDDGYMMQVKDEFANLANDLAPIDLPVAVVRTLSAIAIKQPVMQSEIVRIRGAGAYEHITTLIEKELITKKEEGRSHLLSTTKKFQEYFRLSQDAKALRTQLKDQDKEEKLEALDQQLELPLENEAALPPADPVLEEQAETSQIEASQATIDAQSLSDQIEQNFAVDVDNESFDESAVKKSSKAVSDVADWSNSEEEPTPIVKTSKGKSVKNNPEGDDNIAVTDTHFMTAPIIN